MVRVASWDPHKYDEEIAELSMSQLRAGAEVIAKQVRDNVPVGTVRRPVYQRGPDKGQRWTARTPGSLKSSIRVVEKKEMGMLLLQNRNIRVYAGNFMVYYAAMVEFLHPTKSGFMRKSLTQVMGQLRSMFSRRMAA